MIESCLIQQEVVNEELIWNDPNCQTRIETQTTFILPEAMTIAMTSVDEDFVLIAEDECTICGEETIGDPIFQYTACPSLCQRTDMIGEICRYIDGSVRTQSPSIANT